VKTLTRPDIVLVVLLLALAAASWPLLAHRQDSVDVAGYGDETLYGRFPLNEDRTLEPTPGVIVQIADGRYRIAASTCPHQLCVTQGWQATAPVVCVPNRMMVVAERKKNMMITR